MESKTGTILRHLGYILTQQSFNCIWHFLCLAFEYVDTFYFFRYHLKDVIVGKIYFLLVRIKIKHMELQVIKRESTGTGTL